MRKMLLAALLAAVAVGLVPAATATTAKTVAVSITKTAFVPKDVTVNVGDSVTWVSTDGVPHTSTAALNHLWGDLMTSTDSFTYTFDTPGTYAYFCEMHPAMVGSINVVGE